MLASLERGHAAFATSSGMAAVGLVIQALGEGGHCLAIRGIYPVRRYALCGLQASRRDDSD